MGDKCFDNVCGSDSPLQICGNIIGYKIRFKFVTSHGFNTAIVVRSASRSRLSGIFF